MCATPAMPNPPVAKSGIIYQIEVLRAIAILLVFLYHLGFVFLPSGYIGVDSFFVVSGYLMALLYGNMASVQDAWTFYKKRFNRLLPAYFVVLAASILAAAFILLPQEFGDTQRYGLFSALLLPNIGFWFDASYFDDTYFKAFLNLWSLGVEIQFYVIFPLLIYLFRRSKKLVIAISILSFVACMIIATVSPKTSFFMMPLRIWEFMIGFSLVTSLWTSPGAPERRFAAVRRSITRILEALDPYKEYIGAIALVGLIACAAIPMNSADYPNWVALAVCVLTALVIKAGLPSAFIRNISGRALITLGAYSYSIYLVHFPIIAFLRYQPFAPFFSGTLSPVAIVFAVVATAASAFALHHLVEMPLRRGFLGRWNMPAYAATAALIIAMLPVAAWANQSKYPESTRVILSGWNDRAPYRCGKIDRLLHPFDPTCVIAQSAHPQEKYLLVGDSHADAIKESLAQVALAHNDSLLMVNANCPLGVDPCSPEAIEAFVNANDITTVILQSREGTVDVGATKSLVAMAQSDGFNVALIDPTPEWQQSVIEMLYDAQIGSTTLPVQTLSDYRATNKAVFEQLASIKSPNFTRYASEDYFCTPDCQMADAQNQPYYFDSNHLTLTGAQVLLPLFEKIFATGNH